MQNTVDHRPVLLDATRKQPISALDLHTYSKYVGGKILETHGFRVAYSESGDEIQYFL